MSETITLAAQSRDRAGKGAARATRRAGRVPAVIYGDKKEPVLISLDPTELKRQFRGGAFFSHVFAIDVDGKAKETVLARDLQVDPVTDRPIHVDFMRVSAGTRVTVFVTVEFINEAASPGLKKGGVLNVVRHEIEMLCAPTNIPEHVTIDLTGLEIGDSVHISNVKLPEGVEPTIKDRDFTIVTLVAPSAVKSEGADEGEEEASE